MLVEVVDIENYKAEVRLPREKLVLYLMATYGEQAAGTAGTGCCAAAVCAAGGGPGPD